MAKTIVALETGTWSVQREPVKVKPGQEVTFASDADADYFLGALDADGKRRAISVEEWAELLAENGQQDDAEGGDGAGETDAGESEEGAAEEAPTAKPKPKGKRGK